MIKFEGVNFGYDSDSTILEDLNFTIERGMFYFITGQSGAGKSTLLRLLFLSVLPTTGVIRIFDHDSRKLGRDDIAYIRRRIGIVFQDFRLLNHLSVFENVSLPLRVSGLDIESYRNDVIELLQWVELGDYINSYPNHLSGGEQQRAAIARAVVGQPSLLVADEPTGNVDPELAQKLLRLFVELNKLGTTVVVATHDTSLVQEFNFSRFNLQDKNLTFYKGYNEY